MCKSESVRILLGLPCCRKVQEDGLYIPCVQSFLLKLEELTGIWTMKNVVAEWIHFKLFGII